MERKTFNQSLIAAAVATAVLGVTSSAQAVTRVHGPIFTPPGPTLVVVNATPSADSTIISSGWSTFESAVTTVPTDTSTLDALASANIDTSTIESGLVTAQTWVSTISTNESSHGTELSISSTGGFELRVYEEEITTNESQILTTWTEYTDGLGDPSTNEVDVVDTTSTVTVGSQLETTLDVDAHGVRISALDTQSSQIATLEINASTIELMVTNSSTLAEHGLSIGENSTVLSGGTGSTTLVLNDEGAHFTNTDLSTTVNVFDMAADIATNSTNIST
ncbi:MAG: hypothetical protein V7711_01210, partial [Pseudomonadales bacterium]